MPTMFAPSSENHHKQRRHRYYRAYMNILLANYNMVHTFLSFQDVLTMSVVSIPYARMDAAAQVMHLA